jgi:hypothetical protein
MYFHDLLGKQTLVCQLYAKRRDVNYLEVRQRERDRQADSKGGKDRLTAVVDADHLVCE